MANYEVFGNDKKVYNYYIGIKNKKYSISYLINVTDYIENSIVINKSREGSTQNIPEIRMFLPTNLTDERKELLDRLDLAGLPFLIVQANTYKVLYNGLIKSCVFDFVGGLNPEFIRYSMSSVHKSSELSRTVIEKKSVLNETRIDKFLNEVFSKNNNIVKYSKVGGTQPKPPLYTPTRSLLLLNKDISENATINVGDAISLINRVAGNEVIKSDIIREIINYPAYRVSTNCVNILEYFEQSEGLYYQLNYNAFENLYDYIVIRVLTNTSGYPITYSAVLKGVRLNVPYQGTVITDLAYIDTANINTLSGFISINGFVECGNMFYNGNLPNTEYWIMIRFKEFLIKTIEYNIKDTDTGKFIIGYHTKENEELNNIYNSGVEAKYAFNVLSDVANKYYNTFFINDNCIIDVKDIADVTSDMLILDSDGQIQSLTLSSDSGNIMNNLYNSNYSDIIDVETDVLIDSIKPKLNMFHKTDYKVYNEENIIIDEYDDFEYVLLGNGSKSCAYLQLRIQNYGFLDSINFEIGRFQIFGNEELLVCSTINNTLEYIKYNKESLPSGTITLNYNNKLLSSLEDENKFYELAIVGFSLLKDSCEINNSKKENFGTFTYFWLKFSENVGFETDGRDVNTYTDIGGEIFFISKAGNPVDDYYPCIIRTRDKDRIYVINNYSATYFEGSFVKKISKLEADHLIELKKIKSDIYQNKIVPLPYSSWEFDYTTLAKSINYINNYVYIYPMKNIGLDYDGNNEQYTAKLEKQANSWDNFNVYIGTDGTDITGKSFFKKITNPNIMFEIFAPLKNEWIRFVSVPYYSSNKNFIATSEKLFGDSKDDVLSYLNSFDINTQFSSINYSNIQSVDDIKVRRIFNTKVTNFTQKPQDIVFDEAYITDDRDAFGFSYNIDNQSVAYVRDRDPKHWLGFIYDLGNMFGVRYKTKITLIKNIKNNDSIKEYGSYDEIQNVEFISNEDYAVYSENQFTTRSKPILVGKIALKSTMFGHLDESGSFVGGTLPINKTGIKLISPRFPNGYCIFRITKETNVISNKITTSIPRVIEYDIEEIVE